MAHSIFFPESLRGLPTLVHRITHFPYCIEFRSSDVLAPLFPPHCRETFTVSDLFAVHLIASWWLALLPPHIQVQDFPGWGRGACLLYLRSWGPSPAPQAKAFPFGETLMN